MTENTDTNLEVIEEGVAQLAALLRQIGDLETALRTERAAFEASVAHLVSAKRAIEEEYAIVEKNVKNAARFRFFSQMHDKKPHKAVGIREVTKVTPGLGAISWAAEHQFDMLQLDKAKFDKYAKSVAEAGFPLPPDVAQVEKVAQVTISEKVLAEMAEPASDITEDIPF